MHEDHGSVILGSVAIARDCWSDVAGRGSGPSRPRCRWDSLTLTVLGIPVCIAVVTLAGLVSLLTRATGRPRMVYKRSQARINGRVLAAATIWPRGRCVCEDLAQLAVQLPRTAGYVIMMGISMVGMMIVGHGLTVDCWPVRRRQRRRARCCHGRIYASVVASGCSPGPHLRLARRHCHRPFSKMATVRCVD